MNFSQSFFTKNGEFSIVQTFELNLLEFEQFNLLLEACVLFDGVKPKIYSEFLQVKRRYPANFLIYKKENEHSKLVAYFSYFLFEHDQTEILAFVHPEHRQSGIFTHLFKIITEILKNFSVKTCFFVIPENNEIAKICAKKYKSVLTYYEYHMERSLEIHEHIPDHNLQIRQANARDVPGIAAVDQECFQTDYSIALQRFTEILTYSNREIWVCYLDDLCIGNAHVTFETNNVSIHNIGIFRAYRNKGYATILLKTVINHLLDNKNIKKISLDVSSENSNALAIYQKCGFYISTTYEYWKFLVV